MEIIKARDTMHLYLALLEYEKYGEQIIIHIKNKIIIIMNKILGSPVFKPVEP
jgi:hypothetical protein